MDQEQLQRLAEAAERRAAEEAAARRDKELAEQRERAHRAQERYANALQQHVSCPVYYLDRNGLLYQSGEVPREYRKRPPPTPLPRPKKWRLCAVKVYGPTEDLATGEWEYKDTWVLA